MRKWIIKNVNPIRTAYYNGEQHPPFFLKGRYVFASSGDTTNDLARAHFYDDDVRAYRQAAQLTKRFKVGGNHFGKQYARYPDSCGKAGYSKYEPKYEVVAVEIEVKEV